MSEARARMEAHVKLLRETGAPHQQEHAMWLEALCKEHADMAAQLQEPAEPPPQPELQPAPQDKPAADLPLEDHTVTELRAIAQAEGVDLAGATLKADIVAAIEKHRDEQA